MKFLVIIFLLFSFQALGREPGQTEITTDEGIEVFQQEKYYLLKKNVNIISDDFELKADLVKAYFNEGLYDVVKIESTGNVILTSSRGIRAIGEKIDFDTKKEDIKIYGKKSLLITNEITMSSDGIIKVNNLTGLFTVNGFNSNLKSNEVDIHGYLIDGKFIKLDKVNEIENLYVEDETEINIKTENLNMYALKAKYDKKINIIELFNNVKIFRENETIYGDYAKINTLNETYKITSKKSKKVKALLKEKKDPSLKFKNEPKDAAEGMLSYGIKNLAGGTTGYE